MLIPEEGFFLGLFFFLMLQFSGEVIDFAYLTQHLLGNLEQTPLVFPLLRQALSHSAAGAASRGEQVCL